MNKHALTWNKLVRHAQTAPAEPVEDLPFGFVTRVIAQWHAQRLRHSADGWEGLILPSLGVAVLIFAGCSVCSYHALSGSWTADTSVAAAWLEDLLTL